MSKGVCLECGGPRDRGPYTKLCTSCYVKPCRRCGEPNLRGPYTVLCSDCKDLPPKEDRSVCKRCTQPNDRGGRTTICSVCLAADSTQNKKATAKLRNAEAPRGQSWCSSCEQYLPRETFYSRNESTCTGCRTDNGRTKSLEKNYGITEAEYFEIFEAQGRKCAICGNKPKKQRFAVDHDHKTGQVRGILCSWCNHRLLGGAHDSIDYLRGGIAYLENPPAVAVIGEKFTAQNRKKPKGLWRG